MFKRFDIDNPERFITGDIPMAVGPDGQPMPGGMPPEQAAGGSAPKPGGVASRPGVAVSPVKR